MIKTKYINVSTKSWRATPLDCDHNTKLYKTLWEKFKIYYFILVWIYVSCNWSGIYTLYLCYILYVYYAYLFTLCILYILIKHYMYIKYIFTLTKWRYIHTHTHIYICMYLWRDEFIYQVKVTATSIARNSAKTAFPQNLYTRKLGLKRTRYCSSAGI